MEFVWWIVLLLIVVFLLTFCPRFRRITKNSILWILGLFGYKDDSSWGKVVKRSWGTCMVLLASCVAIVSLLYVGERLLFGTGLFKHNYYYSSTNVSRFVEFYGATNGNGQLRNKRTGEVLLNDVEWVQANPDDSLAVFSTNNKRGYFNKYTGKVIIPATYDYAWFFSEDVAAVVKDETLMFINRVGQKAFNSVFKSDLVLSRYVFEGGHCVVCGTDGKMGLIDHQGNWALAPEYPHIRYDDGLWVINRGDSFGVFDAHLKIIMPFEYDFIEVEDDGIYCIHAADNHMMKLYSLDGKTLLNPAVIADITMLYYETDKMDDNENYILEHATLSMYQCKNYDKSGLITHEGKIVTCPIFDEISAIGKDLYLCLPQGILLNSRGEEIR